MEVFNILDDLEQLGTALDINFLKHMYSNFKPQHSKFLAEVKNSFRLNEFEVNDFRSGYQSLVDFLYGWEVEGSAEPDTNQKPTTTNGGRLNTANNARSITPTTPRTKRPTREIRLADEIEQQECDRLLKTFQTVYSIHRRSLTKHVLMLEDKHIGFLGKQKPKEGAIVKNEAADEPQRLENGRRVSVAASRRQSVVGERRGSILQTTASLAVPTALTGPEGRRMSTSLSRRNTITEDANSRNTDPSSGFPYPTNTAPALKEDPKMTLEDAETAQEMLNQLYNDIDKTLDYFIFCLLNAITVIGFSELLKDNKSYERYLTSIHNLSSDFIRDIVQRLYQLFNFDLEKHGGLMFLLNEAEAFTAQNTATPTKVGGMVSGDKAYLKEIQLCDIRNMDSFRENVYRLMHMKAKALEFLENNIASATKDSIVEEETEGEEDKGDHYFKKIKNACRLSKIPAKFGLINELMNTVDIYLFPRFVLAHRDGLKSFEASTYDSSYIWVTGGFDCLIRIYDLNTRQCLSQLAGHRSIITDVHFVPGSNDAKLVSSSFDRTIKLWNAQSATCERSFQGHTESILSCDVCTEGRQLIASGSTDNSVRIWDLNTGDCLAVIKRHTRWVKLVRFTKDGKYMLTAGLDRRIYIWDVKVVLTSAAINANTARSETDLRPNAEQDMFPCLRSLEAHRDYILDIATTPKRPTWVLSCSRDTMVKVHDFTTGELIHEITLDPSWACTVAFGPDGNIFASGSFDNNIILFDADSGARLRQLRVFNLGITGISFTRTYDHIVCSTKEGFLQLVPL